MARQKRNICASCERLFLGRAGARTCSARCRKRLQRATQALAKEGEAAKHEIESAVKKVETFIEPSVATEEGFIGESIPVNVIKPQITPSAPQNVSQLAPQSQPAPQYPAPPPQKSFIQRSFENDDEELDQALRYGEREKSSRRLLRFSTAALMIIVMLGGILAVLGISGVLPSSQKVTITKLGNNITNVNNQISELTYQIKTLKGETGANGQSGSNGSNGTNGANGSNGTSGENGINGSTGAQGTQGPQGATGATGASGAQGPQGETGATGATGASGPAGPQGATGPQGPSGTATCPNGPCLSLQSTTPGVQESGNINITGDINVGGTYKVAGVQIASVNLADGGNLAKLNGTGPQIFTGNNRFTALLTVANVFNTTNAFQVQNANSTAVFTTDTVNNRVAIDRPTANYPLDVQGDINTSGLYRINGVQISTSNLSDGSNLVTLSGNQTISGAKTFTSGSNSFTGNGSGLTNLNATNITSGTLDEARLPTTLVKLAGNNTFTGTNIFKQQAPFTTAFQIQNSGGTDLIYADTNNMRVGINRNSANYTLDVNGSINGGAITGTSVSATTLLQNNNEVCDVTGNCAGIGGTVGGSGTPGYIPLWQGSGTLTDSNVSLSGSTVNVLGSVNVQDTCPFCLSHYYVNGHQLYSGDLQDNNNIAHLNAGQTFTGGNTFWDDVVFRDISPTSSSFLIQASGGANLLVGDAVNGIITINQTSSNTPLTVNGYINTSTAYKVNGTAGTGITCTDGSIIQNPVVVGGIITDGQCVANGGELSGTLTLQNVYDNSSTGRITTSSPSKGFSVRAGSGNDSSSVFQVQNSSGTNVLSVDTTSNSVVVDQGNLSIIGLSAPASVSVSSSGSGGSLVAATYYYKVAAVNVNGTTDVTASSPSFVVTSGSSSQNTVSWASVSNAISYNVYRSTNGSTWFVNNVASPTVSINDNGSNFSWGSSATPPSANTTGGNIIANGRVLLQNATDSTSALQLLDAAGNPVLVGNSTDRWVGINVNPRATLDVQASSADYSNGFESGSLAPDFVSASGWSILNGGQHSGSWSVFTQTDSSSMSLTKVLNSPGRITFWERFATNNCIPQASGSIFFQLDGVTQQSTSSTDGYLLYSVAVSAGTHTFTWRTGCITSTFGQFTNYGAVYLDDVTITNTSTGTAALFNGGNVGIGTTSPNASLEVAGNALFRPSVSDNATNFQIQNAAGGAIFNVDTLGSNITVSQGNLIVTGLGVPAAPTFSVGSNQGGSLSGGQTYYYKITAINSSGHETLASQEASFSGSNFTPLSAPGAPSLALTTGTDLGIGLYRYKITFTTNNGETTDGTTASITTTSGNQDVNLSNIPLGPTGTIARKIYRTAVGDADGTQKLVATINDNTTSSYSDTTPDGSLGSNLPGSNTATTDTNNLVLSFSIIQGATTYRIYRGTSSGVENSYQTTSTSPFTDTGSSGTGSSTPTSSSVERVGIGTSTPSANLDVAGNVLFQNAINTTTAFQIQNSAGSSNLLIADTVNSRIGIGKVPTQGILDVNGDIYQNGNAVCDTSGNCAGTSSGGIGGSGTAGTIPVFTLSGYTVGDSILTQAGGVITAAGDINTTGMYQVNGVQVDSSILSNDANLAKLDANQTFTGINTFSNSSNIFTGSFSGNGSGLTSLNASSISSGTLSDNQLSSNVALRNANQTFSGNNTFSSASNSFTGNGSGLSALNGSNISSGTVGDTFLSSNVALRNATQTFTGNSNIFQNSSNSTGAFQIQNQAGNSNLFIADTTNTRVGIGKAPTLGTLDVNGTIYQSGNQVCDTSGNCVGGGSGSAIGGSGTAGTIALFTGSGVTIGNSILTQSGSTVSAGGNLTVNGNVLAKNTSNSTSAFRIQDASSNNIFTVDTSNKYIGINQALPNAALDVSATSGSFFDGFESGTLTPFTNSGNANWVISSSSPHTGSFYANSGTLTSNGQSSVLTLTKTLNSPGTISFWYKTDAQGSSFGRFAIDGGTQINCTSSVGCASGSWTQFTSSSLTAGSHTFTWTAQCNFNTLFAYFLLDDVTVTNAGAGSAATFNGGNVGIGTAFPGATLEVSGTTLFGNTSNSTSAFQVQNSAGNNYLAVDTSGATVSVGNTSIASTIQIGNTTGAVTQTINIGNNSTASSTNNVNIGSSIAGSTAITGPTTVTNRTSGSSDTFSVSNSTSTGAIAKFLDGGSANPVFSLADGGAATYRNQTDSTAAFSIQNAAGTSTLNADTTNRYIGINTSAPNAALDVAASSASFFDGFETGSLSPFTNAGSVNWVAQASSARTGTWSATGNLPAFNAGPARMQLTRTVNSPGTVSFYFFNTSGGLTSGSLNFQFLIDGAQQYQCWKGAGGSPSCATSYSQLSFAVASGAHTFEWRVNGSNSSGAMIITVDDINITNAGTANAALINGGLVGIGTSFPNATLDLAAVGSTTDALNVSNSSSSGSIAKFFDGGSTNAVFSLADGGAATFRNQTNSTTALSIQNSAGTSILNADSTNRYVGINNSTPNATLDVVGISGSFFDGFESSLLTPFTTSATGGGNLWTVSSTDPRTGTFHARVTDDQTNGRRSNLTLVRTLSAPGTVSFYWKNTLVNDGSMGAIFQIDGVTQTGCGLGFGACASYALNSFAVTSGTHTFLWQGQVNSAAPQGIDFRLDDVTVTNAGTATSALFNGGNVGIGTAFPTQTLELSGTALFGNTSNSTTAFQVQNSAGNNYLAVDTSGASISVGNTSIASTIQVGNTTGAVTQAINIGNNSTASSTNNVSIGSSVAGTTAITGTTTVTGRSTDTSSNTAFSATNGGTGNIAKFLDSGSATAVFSLVDGGAANFRNQTNSTAAFVIQDASANPILNADSTNRYIGLNQTAPNATLDVQASSASFFDGFETGSLSPFTSSTWSVQSPGHTGSFLAQTQGTGSRTLDLTQTLNSTGTVSFWWHCEYVTSGAHLFFKIDSSEVEVSPGSCLSFPSGNYSTTVASGTHTFTWRTSEGVGFNVKGQIDDVNITNAGTAKAALLNGGNVGIGTAFPNATLEVSGTVLFGNTSNSTTAFQIQNSAGNNYLAVDTSGASVSVGNTSIASTVQIGNTTGAVSQTINVGSNSTASSTNNVNIGSSIAGTTTITGATTVNGRSTDTGSNTTLSVANAGTGNIAKFLDSGSATSVFSLIDGGAANFRNQTDSSTAFQIQNSAGNNYIQADTSGANLYLGNTGIASTIQIGNTTGAVAQTINIGNNNTASSSTTVVLGSTIGLSPTTIQAGSSGVLVKPANSAVAFQVQNASSNPLFVVDSTSSIITFSGTTTTFATITLAETHLKSTQTNPPTIGTPSNCGTSPSAAVTTGSTDTAGSFTITAGTGGGYTTCDVVFTFNKAYGAAPKSIIISPTTAIGSATGLKGAQVSASSTTDFTVQLITNPAGDSEINGFYYWVIE